MLHLRRQILLIFAIFILLSITIVVYWSIGSHPRRHSNFFQSSLILDTDPEYHENVLVNLQNFNYVLRCRACDYVYNKIVGIIVVTSYVGHDEVRSAHRAAISQEALNEIGLVRVFLLATIPPHEKYITQKAINDESEKFGDLIQGNFQEAYRNLTYKHVMGLRWAAYECSRAKYIIKIDDDTVFDVQHIAGYLNKLNNPPSNKFLAGFTFVEKKPIRFEANKWYVTLREFPGEQYPSYLSGWLYLTNAATAKALVQQSESTDFFWIDDTYVTGILRQQLDIPLIKINHWFSANSEFIDCCIDDLMKFKLECDYFVGPNGGDTKLITKFVDAVSLCRESGCIQRPPSRSVRNTCVGHQKRLLPEHGDAVVQSVKM